MPCVRSTRWIGCYPSLLQKSDTFLAKGVMTIPSPELKEGSFPARTAFIMERSSARVLAEARMKRGELFIPSMTSGIIARHLDGSAVTRLWVRNGGAVDALLGRNHCGYLEFRGMEKSDRLVVNRSRRIIRLLFRKWIGLDLLGCGSGTESSTLRCAYRFAAVLPFLAV